MNKWSELEERIFNCIAAESYRLSTMGVEMSDEEVNQIEEEVRNSWELEMD